MVQNLHAVMCLSNMFRFRTLLGERCENGSSMSRFAGAAQGRDWNIPYISSSCPSSFASTIYFAESPKADGERCDCVIQ